MIGNSTSTVYGLDIIIDNNPFPKQAAAVFKCGILNNKRLQYIGKCLQQLQQGSLFFFLSFSTGLLLVDFRYYIDGGVFGQVISGARGVEIASFFSFFLSFERES